MADERKVSIFFGNEHSVIIRTNDPDKLIKLLTEKQKGWVTYEDYTFNLCNITYIKVKNSSKQDPAKELE
ncbi:hypothetical protein [Paenibacillus sp. IHBB 10380]|uniref:hypothetical protein n=1 Tax=Paenibacillus sp. IHBB 10380 TaxID=1566358 RepID=UPI0005CFCB31|nr:hypothetical protein [Paenibacillus sp. IHBB 10380]AJS59946.1 hypothetical protein UB51_17360 [Paenibacillus sp. IHBB 10380]